MKSFKYVTACGKLDGLLDGISLGKEYETEFLSIFRVVGWWRKYVKGEVGALDSLI